MTEQAFGNVKIAKLATPQTTGTADVTGTSVDVTGFSGVAFLTTIPTANAGNFLKVQHSDDNSSFNDVAGSKAIAGTNADVVGIDLGTPTKRYARPVLVRAGVTTTSAEIYAVLYGSEGGTITNPTGVVTTALVSAASGTP